MLNSIEAHIYNRTIFHCKGYLMKTAYLASNAEFELFQWSWPGNHQPLHAMIIVLNFLNDFPYAQLAPDCREAVDLILALHEKNFGLVPGAQAPEPTRRIAKGGSEAWRYFFHLRNKAWQAAGLDPSHIWPRLEAVSLCLNAMKHAVSNERIVQTFATDDPGRNLSSQHREQSTAEGNFAQSQIDAILYGDSETYFGEMLW
jgi:hypothetical protein